MLPNPLRASNRLVKTLSNGSKTSLGKAFQGILDFQSKIVFGDPPLLKTPTPLERESLPSRALLQGVYREAFARGYPRIWSARSAPSHCIHTTL